MTSLTSRPSRVRWWILGLLFAATTINYIDRFVLGVLKPVLMPELNWTEANYASVVFAFQLAYAVGLISMGGIIDRIGVRIGLAVAVVGWSLASASHAFASTLAGFIAARFALGLAEAGNFPACVRATADWFPRRERAFATGLFNSGSNIGAIVTPLAIPFLTAVWGWRAAFLCTGVLGLLWLVWWLRSYAQPHQHPQVDAAELTHIHADGDESGRAPRWVTLLGRRSTWGFMGAKFLTDPVWWFYLFWIPGWLFSTYHLDVKTFGLPLVVIYLISDAGSIVGGWASSRLIHAGWSVNAARKTVMLICALAVLPVVALPWISSLWGAVAIIGLATAAHQGWSANLFTTVGDSQPRLAVASVVGLGGTAGAIGGMGIATMAGWVLTQTGALTSATAASAAPSTSAYLPLFVVCSSAYLIALLYLHLLVPKLGAAPKPAAT